MPGSTRRGGEIWLSSLQIVIAIWAGWTRTWGQCSNWGSKKPQILWRSTDVLVQVLKVSWRICCFFPRKVDILRFNNENFWRGQWHCQGLAMVKHEIEDVGFGVFDMSCMTWIWNIWSLAVLQSYTSFLYICPFSQTFGQSCNLFFF